MELSLKCPKSSRTILKVCKSMAANGVACVLGGRRPHPFVAVTVSFLWGIVCSKSLLVLSREGWNDPQWLSNNNPSNPHSHPFPTFSTRISASDGCMRQVCRRDSDGKQEVGGPKVEAASASWKSRVKRSQWIWIIYMYRDIYIDLVILMYIHIWLVVWIMFFFIQLGISQIPTEELHHFSGC